MYIYVPGDNLKARKPADFHIAEVVHYNNEHLVTSADKTLCKMKIDFPYIVGEPQEAIKIEEELPNKHKGGNTVCSICMEVICSKVNFRIANKRALEEYL